MALNYASERHHIGIVRTDSSISEGFMLVTRNGVPVYQRIDEDTLSEQRGQGTPGYGWFPADRELPLLIDSWQAGFGQYIYDANDPSRYFESKNVDGRFRHGLIAGPKETAIAAPLAQPTMVDADIELGTWGTGDGAQSDEQAHGGTYSWKLTEPTGTARTAYQELTGYVPGATYTFTMWCYISSQGGGVYTTLVIDDGVGTTTSALFDTLTTWTQLTVTRKLDAAATKLSIEINTTAGAAITAYFDDAACTLVESPVARVSIDFAGNRYQSFGQVLYKLNGTGDGWTLVKAFSGTIRTLEVFKNQLIVGTEPSLVIEDCEDAWTAGANVTASLDTGDYKVGSGSAKFVVTSTPAAGAVLCYEDFDIIELTDYSGITIWIKCSIATSNADLQILLDDTSGCVSAIEKFDVPALTANEWKRCTVKSADPSLLTGVISIGIENNVDIGACTIWIDAVQAAELYWYMDAGETFTQSTHAQGFAHFFKAINAASPTLYKVLKPNMMRSATTAINTANWSATDTLIDTQDYDVTALVSDENNNQLVMAKEDRVFYLDATPSVQILVGDTQFLVSSTGGQGSWWWQGKMYFPYGTQSLVEYDDGTITWRDPSKASTNTATYDGRIFTGAGDDQWNFIAVDNGSSVEIMAGSIQVVDATARWVWHPVCQITLAGAQHMAVSSIYKKRLWITSTDSTQSVYYIPLPDGYGDPTTDANRSFNSGGNLDTPFYHLNFKGTSKSYVEITLAMEDTTANVYWRCYYQKLGDSSWTEINSAGSAYFKTSPTTTAYIPVDGSSNNPTSTAMRFRFVPITNSATATPVLLSAFIKGLLYPAKRKVIQCVVRCADNITDKAGNSEGMLNATDIKTVLDEANEATWPVTFYDIDGATKTVRFLPMREVVTKEEVQPYRIEKSFELVLQEITLS